MIEDAIEYLTGPIAGSPSFNKKVCGIICLHVDDIFMAGDKEFHSRVVDSIKRDFQIGSEDKNDILFVGQRIRWVSHKEGDYISVDQGR